MQELGRQFGLNHSTRMLQYTSSTFDPSVLEIFGTLIHGGAVCIPTETQRLNDIPAAINEMQVNTAVFVPSVLKLLRPEQIPAVEKLIIGGEALPKALVDLWAPRTRLINAYGPTETCVCSVANLRVAPGGYAGSIGTPIACRAWVVDPCNPRRLMPVGAVGELWIEGPTVARGYLDNEAATKASFFSPLPWSAGGTGGDGGDGDDPARVLRTGDLVRYLPDGTLVFLGRKDKQIKLDGHRIELEEIEAVICRSAFVSGASVQLVETANSSPTLAAFIVPADVDCRSEDSGEILDQGRNNGHIIGRLRGLLQAQLPARMVPQNMIAVTCIPRMTSGKVDQRRLTALFEDEVRLSHHHAACRSKANCTLDLNELPETYTAMRDLWAIALEIPPHHICANARFLHLGGNSIKAMKLVAAARSSGLSLTVNDVLTNTYTLDEMARRVGKPAAIREPIPAEPLVTTQAQTPSRSRRAYTPTWIQTVSLTTVGAFPEGNYTRIILDLRGPLDLTRLREAIQSLVTRNEILRTQYSLKDDGSGIEATVLDAGEISTPLIRFNSLSEAVESWESVPATCFNRQLAEFSYVVTDKASTRFALGLQHSQYDAWTVPLVLRQLQSLYHVPQAGTQYHHPSQSLPPPGPPFSEYATRLARESNPEAQRFWKEQLAGVSMTILGNTDKNGSADEPDGHFQRSVHLPHSRFTPATIIYTAWALVLSRHAQNTNPNPNPNPNSRKILFGSAVSGRNIDMPGILNVVGPCINMIPFAVSVDISEPRNRCTGATCTSACTYIDALQSVQNAMLATVPYEAMPLPEIIARCTDWDPAGVFGSIVQHLDIGFGIPLTETGTGTGTGNATRALEWKFLETRKRYGRCRATDIYIFSSTTATTTTTPSTSTSTSDEGDSTSNTTVDVQMKYNPSHIAPALAGVLFAELCGHIEAMRRDPAEAILENGL
ncbi:hypothetical protein BJY00DRAFT_299051 [Aspergillus carlsbadensis]|nr:hypothetical protein BJY00DRAFT_299051 [Aspergillus carlsbadensis]